MTFDTGGPTNNFDCEIFFSFFFFFSHLGVIYARCCSWDDTWTFIHMENTHLLDFKCLKNFI